MKFFLFLCCCSLSGFAQKVVVQDSDLRIRCRANGGWTRITLDNEIEKIPLGLGVPFSVKGRQ